MNLVEENDSNEEWFTEVLKIWKESETTLVSKGKVLNMGVADFQLPELKRLFEAVTVKPRVVHVFIEGCCMVNFAILIKFFKCEIPTAGSTRTTEFCPRKFNSTVDA